jgi:FkbH-like protein
MEARIGDCSREDVPRVVQLLAKTNQFNLTGRRYTEPQLQARQADPTSLVLRASLRDKFGDHGLVSVLVASLHDDTCEIENWVMSCRVFKRGLEAAVFGEVRRRLAPRGIRRVRGTLIATGKNGYVAELFPSLGFQSLPTVGDGAQAYELELDARDSPAAPRMRIEVLEVPRD